MNAYELQALRHIFAMTIDECATWIAQTGDSESWRQWENGKCAIPDRVVEQLLAMRQQRKKHLHAIIEKINNRIGNNTMRFFPDLTAFQQVYPDGNFIDWKMWGGDRFCMRGSLPRKRGEALRDKALGRASRICTAGRKMRFYYDLCDEFCTITDC